MSNEELVKSGEKREKVERRKGSRPDRTVQLEPGDGGKFIGNALEVGNLPDIDTNDAEEVRKRIIEYFEISMKNDVKPSVAGMALALGIDRRTLWLWVSSENKPKEVLDVLKKAYSTLNLLMEDYMQNGKVNPVSGIFLMKNNMGYTDKQEVVLTPNNPLGEIQDRKELEDRYLSSVPEEAAESDFE